MLIYCIFFVVQMLAPQICTTTHKKGLILALKNTNDELATNVYTANKQLYNCCCFVCFL